MEPGSPLSHWKESVIPLVLRPGQRWHSATVHPPSALPHRAPDLSVSSDCQNVRDIAVPPVARMARAKPILGLLTSSLSPRYDEGSEGSGDEGKDEAHKREWRLFYQKQMNLRKVKGTGG